MFDFSDETLHKQEQSKTLQILLVEDDLFDYQAVKRFLRPATHIHLVHAENLRQAMQMAQEKSFDCFILDWYLPDGDGEQFLSFAAAAVPWTPTIIMTSGMEDLLTSSALALGAQDYILKGQFDSDSLYRSIEFAIARKHAERQRWSTIQADRLHFINQIVAGVAHEINNPIAWISSNVDLIRYQFEEDEVDASEVLELCMECAEGVERIASVVKVLRTYAEAGDRRMELGSLVPVVEKCLGEIGKQKEWGISSSVVAPQSLPQVLVDQGAIKKALYQILLNAFQAAERHTHKRDGVYLKGQVEVHFSIEDRMMVIDVHDSGRGLDPSIVAHVFEPFYSSQRNTNLGMGLAIAYDVIANHRGSIAIMPPSPLGGAWLRVTLPIM